MIWPHRHDVGDGKMLALVTGLVPCPLTTFILTYALARGKPAIGLAAVAGMLAVVIVTLVAFGQRALCGTTVTNGKLAAQSGLEPGACGCARCAGHWPDHAGTPTRIAASMRRRDLANEGMSDERRRQTSRAWRMRRPIKSYVSSATNAAPALSY
jgi:hypothetical protein